MAGFRTKNSLQKCEGVFVLRKSVVLVHTHGRGKDSWEPMEVNILASTRILATGGMGATIDDMSYMQKEATRKVPFRRSILYVQWDMSEEIAEWKGA